MIGQQRADRSDLVFLLNDGELAVPRSARTYSGFLKWLLSDASPEKLRASYVSGVLRFDFANEPLDTHNLVKGGFYACLLPFCLEHDFGRMYPSGVLFGNRAADLLTHPDALAFSWNAVDTGLVRFIQHKGEPRGVEGSPEWVLEVVDDNSVGWDKNRLRRAYHQAGVREYWLVDARHDELDFQMLEWRSAAYVKVRLKDGWQRSKVFGREFQLVRKRNWRGAWHYTLLGR